MFNFFKEISEKIDFDHDLINEFNIVNMSGKALYVEGHKGVTSISSEMVAFKIKRGRVVIEGDKLTLKELSQNTILLQGKIKKVEIF